MAQRGCKLGAFAEVETFGSQLAEVHIGSYFLGVLRFWSCGVEGFKLSYLWLSRLCTVFVPLVVSGDSGRVEGDVSFALKPTVHRSSSCTGG